MDGVCNRCVYYSIKSDRLPDPLGWQTIRDSSPASQCDRFNVRSVGCPRATGSEQSLSQEINKDIQLRTAKTHLAGSTVA